MTPVFVMAAQPMQDGRCVRRVINMANGNVLDYIESRPGEVIINLNTGKTLLLHTSFDALTNAINEAMESGFVTSVEDLEERMLERTIVVPEVEIVKLKS